jgi:lipopolysaccharide cholinephosphotransferase
MDFNTLFPDEREKGETPLRQCQSVMLRMLKIFDYLCNKHRIQYFLVGGSLLGAIRHQGFIPWDDDLDVGMTRREYEKFVQYAVPELPQDIFFQTPETDSHFPSCVRVETRLRDKYSSYNSKDKSRKWHHGLMLDIFIYDKAYLPHNIFIFGLNRSLQIFFWKVGPKNKNNQYRSSVLNWISKYVPLPFVYASCFICSSEMIKMGTNFIRAKEIAEVEKVKFEDMEVFIPKGWDACLRRQYGNYMQLPPAEQRVGLHSKGLPDPFTPCEHEEILNWKNKESAIIGHQMKSES